MKISHTWHGGTVVIKNLFRQAIFSAAVIKFSQMGDKDISKGLHMPNTPADMPSANEGGGISASLLSNVDDALKYSGFSVMDINRVLDMQPAKQKPFKHSDPDSERHLNDLALLLIKTQLGEGFRAGVMRNRIYVDLLDQCKKLSPSLLTPKNEEAPSTDYNAALNLWIEGWKSLKTDFIAQRSGRQPPGKKGSRAQEPGGLIAGDTALVTQCREYIQGINNSNTTPLAERLKTFEEDETTPPRPTRSMVCKKPEIHRKADELCTMYGQMAIIDVPKNAQGNVLIERLGRALSRMVNAGHFTHQSDGGSYMIGHLANDLRNWTDALRKKAHLPPLTNDGILDARRVGVPD